MMRSGYHAPIGGSLVAIAITAVMDANGYAMFSALPLIPLFFLFWYLQGFSRTDIGMVWGGARSYLWGIAYPVCVLGAVVLIAASAGAIDASESDWNKALLNIVLMSTTGIIMVTITEEGFFRGWLWASSTRAGLSERQVLVATTVVFVVWHITAITLDADFSVPPAEVPIYLVNATLLGLIWGTLRMVSGSIVVASVCHALWNGLTYPLFGFGQKVGALGIKEIHLFGPEVGVLGIALNLAFFVLMWRFYVIPSRQE